MNYTWQQFENDCQKIVKKLKKGQKRFTSVYGIPRGGLVLAVKLSHLCEVSLIIDKKKIVNDTLIVDDISDTGKTLEEFRGHLIVTLFYHKQTTIKPFIACREKKNSWITYPWESG